MKNQVLFYTSLNDIFHIGQDLLRQDKNSLVSCEGNVVVPPFSSCFVFSSSASVSLSLALLK